MANQVINTSQAPAAIGPYVQGYKAGNTIYVSGQLGIDMATGELADGVEAQAKCSMANLGAILKEAGATPADVVKTTVFIASMGDFATVNKVYGEFFGENFPARSCIEVGALPKGGLVEVECVAVVSE